MASDFPSEDDNSDQHKTLPTAVKNETGDIFHWGFYTLNNRVIEEMYAGSTFKK